MFNPLLLTKYGLYLYHNPLESSDDVLTLSGEDGIRTHVALPPNGFQDRLVMTASIPLQKPVRTRLQAQLNACAKRSATVILSNPIGRVNRKFRRFSRFFFSVYQGACILHIARCGQLDILVCALHEPGIHVGIHLGHHGVVCDGNAG